MNPSLAGRAIALPTDDIYVDVRTGEQHSTDIWLETYESRLPALRTRMNYYEFKVLQD